MSEIEQDEYSKDTEGDPRSVDLTEPGELCGCTPMQVRFAEGLLGGMSFVEAAAHAGYAGARDSVQLRSAGSNAARSKNVQALLALAESRGLGIPSAPGDMAELQRILWMHARSKDKNASIRATAELDRILREQREEERERNVEPIAVLQELAELMPLVAVTLARENNLPFELNETQRGRCEGARRNIASEWIRENAGEAASIIQQGASA